MDVDELIKAVIDRFSPDELCELLDLTTADMADKFYDEIIDNEKVRDALGLDEDGTVSDVF
jgi:hypothetical protein